MVHSWTRQVVARAVVFVPLALTGCAVFDRPDPNRPDPLTGLPKRIPASDRAVSTTYNPPGDQSRNAMLASSGAKPPESTSGLSIRDSKNPDAGTTQPTGAWTGNESRNSTSPGGGARLGSANPGTADPAPGSSGLKVRTFEEAQQFLGARGVKWQELKNTGDNEWSFSCSIPNKNATSVRTYQASDRYGLWAMQKVIDQILREQQGR
jgi:hypothetical protein